MYLRARNASIYFPFTGKPVETVADPAVARAKTGGMIIQRNGGQYIRALHDINLDLKQGENLSLVGHNGSGKSTLLRALAGIYKPHEGTIEADRIVGGVFNMQLGLRPEATGYRNIILKGLIAGRTRSEIQEKIPEIEEFTELGSYLNMPVRTYSAGMIMRLSFAMTTAFTSDILVLDEWITAGDAAFREKVAQRMESYVGGSHIMVITSHNLGVLQRVTNKTAWLDAGKIVKIGAPEDVIGEYKEFMQKSAGNKTAQG